MQHLLSFVPSLSRICIPFSDVLEFRSSGKPDHTTLCVRACARVRVFVMLWADQVDLNLNSIRL